MEIKLKATKVFDFLCKTTARKIFLVGGADSSKSYSVAQFLLLKKLYQEHNKRILVIRKTTPALRESCYRLIKDLLGKYSLPYILNKTDKEISVPQFKNEMIFKGLDDPEKIKSTEYNIIWVEEATEITFNDYLELVRRLRRETEGVNQIILSFNPISSLHWIKREIVDKPKKNVAINISTYKDNPFAAKEDIEELEELKERDLNQYNVYAKSLWGILKNIIYSNWQAYGSISEYGKIPVDIRYGIDWGYSKPAALIKVYVFENDDVIWEEIIHQKGLTTPAFLELAKERIPEVERSREFFAGTDEPGSITQFYDGGFNIHPAITDVRDGINWCQAHLVGIIGQNIIKEAQGYKRKEDKEGNALEEPVKFMDHGIDAGRYGTYSRIGKQEFPSDTVESKEEDEWYKEESPFNA